MSKKETRREQCANGTLDQIFTKPEHLQHYADLIASHAGTDMPFVDTSCGTGELGVLLHTRDMRVFMFDIDDANLCNAAKDLIDSKTLSFQQKDWLTADASDVPAEGFVAGFNPPFGHRGRIARKFAEHAIRLGATCLVWMAPHMVGKRSRSWLPNGFIVVHKEHVPRNAFSRNGTQFSANADVCIYLKDEQQHIATLEEWKTQDARTLPSGWSIERLNTWFGHNKHEKLCGFPKNENEITLRNTGGSAGEDAIVWHDGAFHLISAVGGDRILDESEERSITQHTIIGVPEYFSGVKRHEFLKLAAPQFQELRRESANKGGVNFADIRSVIFNLSASTAAA